MCNQAYIKLFGHNEISEFIGKSVLEQFSSSEQIKIKNLINKQHKGEEVPNLIITKGLRKNGEEFPLEVNIGSYKINNEIYTVAVIRDLTQRKLAEELFKESSFRYETLLSKTSDGIITLTPEGIITDVNESFALMHGYSAEEILRMNISDLNLPEINGKYREKLSIVLSGELQRFETKHYHKNGNILYLEVTACRISIGDKINIIEFNRNITEQKKAEEALKRSEEKFRTAFLANPDPVIVSRFNDGMCVSINKGFTKSWDIVKKKQSVSHPLTIPFGTMKKKGKNLRRI